MCVERRTNAIDLNLVKTSENIGSRCKSDLRACSTQVKCSRWSAAIQSIKNVIDSQIAKDAFFLTAENARELRFEVERTSFGVHEMLANRLHYINALLCFQHSNSSCCTEIDGNLRPLRLMRS